MLKTQLDRREDLRVPFVTEVTYWLEDVSFRRRSSDLSAAGIYIEDCSPPPVGAAVKVCYTFMGCPIEAEGIVASSQPPIGFGIALNRIDPNDRELVALCLAAEAEE